MTAPVHFVPPNTPIRLFETSRVRTEPMRQGRCIMAMTALNDLTENQLFDIVEAHIATRKIADTDRLTDLANKLGRQAHMMERSPG